jgi:hypothetical protein
MQNAAWSFLQGTFTLLGDEAVNLGDGARGVYAEAIMLSLHIIGPNPTLADTVFTLLGNWPGTAQEILPHFQGQQYPFYNGMFITVGQHVTDIVRKIAAGDGPGSAEEVEPAIVSDAVAGSALLAAAVKAANVDPAIHAGEPGEGLRIAASAWEAEIEGALNRSTQDPSRKTFTRNTLIAALLGIGGKGEIIINDGLLANLEKALQIRRDPAAKDTKHDIGGIQIPDRQYHIILALVKIGGAKVAAAAKDIEGARKEVGPRGNAANIYFKRVLIATKEFLAAK